MLLCQETMMVLSTYYMVISIKLKTKLKLLSLYKYTIISPKSLKKNFPSHQNCIGSVTSNALITAEIA